MYAGIHVIVLKKEQTPVSALLSIIMDQLHKITCFIYWENQS